MLTRRIRVLLHFAPLHQMRESDGKRDPELRHYDSLVLAVKLFDLIVERTGLEHEVDRRAAEVGLGPLLRSMDEAADVPVDAERHRVIVDRVIAALRNDDERRQRFRVRYTDFRPDGTAVHRKVTFALLVDEFHPDGGSVLRLSDAAVNLFLRGIDLDVEDAQAAAEAVVQSQLERGRFGEAVESARAAKFRSGQFAQKIHRLIRDTRRDVSSVDWAETAPKLLDDAFVHLKARIAMEQGILATAGDRLDTLEPDSPSALAVAEVRRLIRDCNVRHYELQDPLMRARNVFLDEQARQVFTRRAPRFVPELAAEVLVDALRLPAPAVVDALAPVTPLFHGARPRPMLSLLGLVTWLLRPRKPPTETEAPVEDEELRETDAEALDYPPELLHRAEDLLVALSSTTRLSELVVAARERGEVARVIELVAFLAFHHYAPDPDEDGQELLLDVERDPGRDFDVGTHAGDDLVLEPRGDDVDRAG